MPLFDQNQYDMMGSVGMGLMAAGAPSLQPGGMAKALPYIQQAMQAKRQRDASAEALKFRDKKFEAEQKYRGDVLGLKREKLKREGGGGFQSKGFQADVQRILVKGDPSTPEYAAAYNYYAQPKASFDQQSGTMVSTNPDMSAYRQPTRGARPAGPRVEAKPIPGAKAKPTEGQYTSAGFADRLHEANQVLDRFERQGLDFKQQMARKMPGGLGNFALSPEFQQFDQARRSFINAILRKESGAVIADSEFDSAEKQYFPQPGDSDVVIKQKHSARAQALKSMSRAAGPSYKQPEIQMELPGGVTEADIKETMRANNMTREQVLGRLGGR